MTLRLGLPPASSVMNGTHAVDIQRLLPCQLLYRDHVEEEMPSFAQSALSHPALEPSHAHGSLKPCSARSRAEDTCAHASHTS